MLYEVITRKFDLGAGAVHKGFTGVNAQSVYTPENGFGSDFGAEVSATVPANVSGIFA